MYEPYLFYGNNLDFSKYTNLKEFERFCVQLGVIIFVIYWLEVTSDTISQFFYSLLYVCCFGFIINFVYNANRILFKKDDESEVIVTYKRMIS